MGCVNWRLVFLTLGLSTQCVRAIASGRRLERTLATQDIQPKKSTAFLSIKEHQPAITVTTHKSWFEKMSDAFSSVIAGIVLIWFSIPVMWINERRAARQESVIAIGKGEIVHVDAAESSTSFTENTRGKLVRAFGGETRSMLPVRDRRFGNVKMDEYCLRLRSTVEAYQHIEQKDSKEKKDNVGGGTTKTTIFTYIQDWSGDKIDSNDFQDKSYHNTVSIDELPLGTQVQTCERVEYGESFIIPTDLVETLNTFETAGDKFNSLMYGPYSLKKFDDQYFYYPTRSIPPNIGDIRVKVEYVSDRATTVMGLQVQGNAGDSRDTFLPYRMIASGCCESVSDEERKSRLIAAGKKDAREMYEEDACDAGPLNIICCCCTCAFNIVTCCFHSLVPPQVYNIFEGDMSERDCWRNLEKEAQGIKWVLRVIGWLMMLGGTYALFQPLIVAFDIIPFLGPYMGSFVGWAIYILCFIATLALATLIISFAYLIYHPCKGLVYLTCACVIAAIPCAFSYYVKSQNQGS